MVVRQSAHAAKVSTTLVIQSSERPTVALLNPRRASPAKVVFSVTYKRLEYLRFVTAHLTATLIKIGKLGADKPLPLYARHLMAVMGSIAFYLKRRKMPVCHFRIDDIGIFRRTQGGLLTLPWSDVVAVHRYELGLLVAKKSGALPLPFRCLTPTQIDILEKLVEIWKSAKGHPEPPTP